MEAVGFASSILTFIDIATKIVRGAYEVHNSVCGATQENVHITAIVNDLEKAARSLDIIPEAKNDHELVKVSKDCQGLSRELLEELDKLKNKHGGVWGSLAAAWAVLRKQKNVISMENRLDKYRRQVQLRLLILLFAAQSPIKQHLQELHQIGVDLSNTSARRMEDLESKLSATLQMECQGLRGQSTDVADKVQRLTSTSNQAMEKIDHLSGKFDELLNLVQDPRMEQRRTEMSEHGSSLEKLVHQLGEFQSLVESLPRENRVLRRLHFASILRREGNIERPASGTFSWAVEGIRHQIAVAPNTSGTPSSFQLMLMTTEDIGRQLVSKELQQFLAYNGSTFFIYGKAGCGKSTLMKFLAHHSLVRQELAGWAGGRKLVTINLFFWRSDDPLQKSLEGFHRTIIYHTLCQCPELMPKVFPCRDTVGTPDAAEFQIKELAEAFGRLMEHTDVDTHRFCYFIDGLDEYEGKSSDHRQLAEQLAAWARSDAVKIICSARPDTIFLKVFTDSGTIVDFGQLNRSDLTKFARARFESELLAPDYKSGHDICQGLVVDIVDKAEGVFVWAVFVVQSLINGVLEGDDDEVSLHERVKDFPTDLNAMFRQMLDRVDPTPHVRRRSDMLLYLVTNSTINRPLNGLLCAWLGDLGWFQDSARSEFPFDRAIEPYDSSVIEEKLAKARKLLHLLTQGLLEIQDTTEISTLQSPTDLYLRYRVDFFHRSVRDFLRDEWKIRRPLFSSAEDEMRAYCRLYIAEAQFFPNVAPQDRIRDMFEYTFIWLSDRVREGHTPPLQYVQQFDHIISKSPAKALARRGSRSPRWGPCFLGKMEITETSSRRWHTIDGHDCSFLHWAAYWHQGAYVRQKLSSGVSIDQVDTTELNLLLSASIGTDVELVRDILSRGGHSTDLVETAIATSSLNTVSGDVGSVPVWMVILRDFASNVRTYCWKRRVEATWPPHLSLEWLKRFAEVLEAHLRAGADPDFFFLVWPEVTESDGPVELCRVNLHQLLDIFKPPNLASLDKLLARRVQGQDLEGEDKSQDNSDMSKLYPPAGLDKLLDFDWEIYGVVFQCGGRLCGDFTVRVF
ncbi:hypothetical protein QBC33DRAFT_487373 [Phialemonium atrogriseum]|uniref:NACHT domain-containing protein n=1 Tax=Phialemonium atrogriseum TaxID=1093897 RepID=A0AAJ0C4Y4_9PEZI|nr:uncharacterized protein QBC33DRAFT_487373 [Phialemonium atrogriseum]KAK1770255.1 hypothetical protein QBC33DRAFT_487373 [Phialemonium atrogriseum]